MTRERRNRERVFWSQLEDEHKREWAKERERQREVGRSR